MNKTLLLLCLSMLCLQLGCQPSLQLLTVAEHQRVDETPIAMTTIPYESGSCSGQFVAHSLDHVTTVASDPVEMFDSNGAGLAVNDLDNDGYLDLVMANLLGDTTILWNQGGLRFEKRLLDQNQTRAAAAVDIDEDGLLDLVFTQRIGSLAYWHNEGDRIFTQDLLSGVHEYAYAMNWADLDRDGDLDLVTASYDAGLEKDLGNTFLLGQGAGIFYFENKAGTYIPARLAERSQALAIHLGDLNSDNHADILVGNDFSVPDGVWFNQHGSWQVAQPFSTTTHSTMSYTAGDINNDGQQALFATDMKPYADDEITRNAWAPVMEMMPHHEVEGDPQIMANVLHSQLGNGEFTNDAPTLGLAATGWSWSAKFGDLDHDGFLDLYVVNGMIATELFGHLSDDALIEQNQALRNDGGTRFVPALEWQLNAETSGRGMSLADLDNDGDLDVVVNNLLAPAQLFENQLCAGASLAIDLRWPESSNTHAIGATLILDTTIGKLTRQVEAVSGYLSGDPSRIHFGFPADTVVNDLNIRWPDGTHSHLPTPPVNVLLQIQR